ncbi:MAG: PAS domain S-box protein [Desulfoplanes sp.]
MDISKGRSPTCSFVFLSIFLVFVGNILPTYGATPLLVRGDQSYPPYEFLNDQNLPDGFNIDIMNAVAQKMGLSVTIKLGPWQTVRTEIEQGKIDVLMGMYKTEERDKLVDFAIPHFIASYALFIPKNSSISSLEDARNRRILVQEDDLGYDFLRQHKLTDQIIAEKRVDQALLNLAAGHGDCALVPRLLAMIIIQKNHLTGITPVGSPILQSKYCFAVPEGRSGLLSELNEGLSIIKYSGEYDRIYDKWFGVYEGNGQNSHPFFKYIPLVIPLLLLVIAVIVLWTWLLRREVNRATKKLWASSENLRITLKSIGDGVIAIDTKGCLTQMNPVAEQLTGWTFQDALSQPVNLVFPIVHGGTRAPLTNAALQVLTTGKPVDLSNHNTLLSKHGIEYHIAENAAPIRDRAGKLKGVVMIFRDISEKYRLQESLRQSEERFQLAMEANKDGIWDWNILTGEIYYSPGYGAILGYDESEMAAHVDTWANRIHPDDYEKAVRANHDCIENISDTFRVGFRMQAKNGTWRWILGRGKAVSRDTHGRATRLVGTHTDITHLKRTEEALTRQNLRYSTLLSNLNGMVYRCKNDTSWTIQFVSSGCLNLTGYSDEDILENRNVSFANLILPAYREMVWNTWQKNLASHTPVEVEYEIKTATGATKWVWEKGCGIFDAQGCLIHIEGFITDISDRKQMEKALEKRIVALTRPIEHAEDITFEDLFNLDDIQRLQDEFSQATGVASMITKPDGTPITRPSNFRRLCRDIIRKTDKGRAACEKSDMALGRINPEGPILRPCKSCGLWDAGASISVGGTHIASWLAGQVRDETQNEDMMRDYARKIGANEEEFIKAFLEVPAMSHEKFTQVAQALFTFANQLSTSAYLNVQQARFISERKQALEKLHRSEEKLRITLDSIGDGVIATDTQGTITLMNPVAEKLTGWTLKEAMGKPMRSVFNIIHAQTRKSAESPVKKVLATGGIVNLANHTVLITRDGSEHQIADSAAPIRSDTGTTLGAVLVFRDVTEEYALQEQLRQNQKMQAIGQLAGGVAHDFNNMLSGIMGAAELLKSQEKHLGSDNNRHVDLILQAATRAADLTTKLLAFGRKNKMTSTTLDLHHLLEDTAAILSRTIDKKIRILMDLHAGTSAVRGDASALQNIVMNLGINASQAMPAGGDIHMTTHNQYVDANHCHATPFILEPGEYIELEIRDTGSGIAHEHLARIFEPFFTTKPPGHGTGLGLAAVYGAVRDHQGAITVFSEEGKGTSFHILLPCVENIVQAPEKHQEQAATTGHVLLVDDEEYIRTTGKLLLEDLGYKVSTAANGLEAVDIFRKKYRHIDIVVMDMMMPEMDGNEALKKMKEIDKNCKVIISSGFTNSATINASKKSGVAGFLRKPYRIFELNQLIAKTLHQ